MGATSSIDLRPVTGASTAALRPGRVGNVDVLRAVAAIAVLAIHSYALGGRVAPIKAQYWYDVPLITLASGVWLFFGVSGYVISRPFVERLVSGREPPSTMAYALRRSFRIYPLYIVVLTAVIVIDGAAGTRGWQFPIHYALLNNLVPGRQEALFSPAWTLTLEVLFYVSVPILAAAVRRGRRPVTAERLAVLVIASWIASIVVTIAGDLAGDGLIGLWLRGSFPAMWQMFCPGILLAIAPFLRSPGLRRWVADLPQGRTAALVAGAALLVAAVLGAAAPLRFGIVPYQLLVDASRPLFAIGYGLVVAVAIRSRPWGAAGRRALELGLVSYGIYLLHPVIIDLMLREGLYPFHRNTLPAFAGNVGLILALTIPLALLSWRRLERPLIDLSRRLGRTRAARGLRVG